jgi:Nuclease-related domain
VESIVREFLFTQLKAVALTLLFLAPLGALVWNVVRMKRRHNEGAENPFRDFPLRPAGESLRIKIEELAERQQDQLLFRLLLAIGAGLAVTASQQQKLIAAIALLAVTIDALISHRKILRITRDLWNARLGFIGERLVGEELSQLLYSGYSVFHDVPFEKYNIDHVIVGPSGVFAVETKIRRKPKKNGSKIGYTISFDGERLHWPNFSESDSVVQAAANARSLSKWLSSSTGEPIFVQPIITAPGWWIDDSNQHPVWVLNPKRIKPFVERAQTVRLAESQLARIRHQLAERCRLRST